MSSLPASLKRIGSIATEKKWWRRFFRRSRAANSIVSGGIWPKFKLTKLLCMSSLPASMKRIRSTAEKIWRSFPHYKSMGIFSNAQGQLTLLSVVGSGRLSNSCKLSCMSSLPASIKRIRSKTVEKTWWRPFPHYNPMGAIRAMETRVLIWSASKPNAASPTPMCQIKFGCNRPAGLGDIHVWCGRTHGRTDARTDARTPARVPSYKLTLWAFGSVS